MESSRMDGAGMFENALVGRLADLGTGVRGDDDLQFTHLERLLFAVFIITDPSQYP